ncbi:HpaII family restriction endonuclease [uncultured Tenacibaculum sp.]|uniref:HpaII family restriction endonuclease n=1 Tax=uncultured Tenacibaculum sp. TaxID=174713 RepID=UPI00261DF1AF|nr:HpaII family restriction endonuclease [uncultured Tenacibaculum sp.]
MKGNKGEWSELYTFFKLLGDGKLFSADENLKKTKSFVELKSIIRRDNEQDLNFRINNQTINIIDFKNNQIISSFNVVDAKKIADDLAKEIKKGKISIPKQLIDSIQKHSINKVTNKSQGKGDINLVIYDPIHGITSSQEFSIKSFLGSTPTLFNANKTTNITYKITDKNNNPVSKVDLTTVNSIGNPHKYIKRISKISELGYDINFHSYDDDTFKLNLQVIDSDLPQIIAHIVKDKFVSSKIKFTDIISKINEENPMNYDLSQGHKFYEYRLVNFLVEAALGMTSKTVWSGKYDIVGGIIIVKPDTEVLCYHVIDFNKFKTYLKNSSKLDNPSGSKMGYGEVYFDEHSKESFIKLNFQIKA